MGNKLVLGRYDYAGYSAFISYALCSLSIPLTIVAMGKSLNFPLDAGGMAAGGTLHLIRSIAIVAALLLCGAVAGRFGKRVSMGCCMLMTGVGILLCGLAPVYWVLIPCLLFAGFGEGICEGVATPFVQDLHRDAPERYVNIAHGMWSVGILLCVVLAGGLLTLGVSWRLILVGCGVMAALSSLLFLWKERAGQQYAESAEKTGMRQVLQYSGAIARTPRFWVYCLGMFMGAGAEFCLTFWAAAYLQLGFDAGAWFVGLGTGAIALGMFLGRTLFGYFAKREYLKHLLLFSGLGTIPLSLLLVVLRPEMFPSTTVLFTALFGILFLCGIGIAPYWPSLQVHGVANLPELDSTMLYIYFSAMGIPGCGFFTWMMGVLGDHFGLRGAFLLIPGSLVLFCLIIFFEGWVFKNRRESAEENAPSPCR